MVAKKLSELDIYWQKTQEKPFITGTIQTANDSQELSWINSTANGLLNF